MDNYTKLRIIGTGSFGNVWLVRSKINQRNYVLKEISLSVAPEERAFVLNEVQVLSKLRHKNIIRYKEAFLNDGLLCISMEFAHEGDLSSKIKKQCGRMFPTEQVIDWFIQLCLSLKYLHGMNILHRDIKCQNIFLTKDGVIKLGDFGISRMLQNTLDHAQTVIGTPYYLSPEICQSQPYNHKSDIWALGCVLYEMVTLRHPFESADFTGLVLKILCTDYTPIPESRGLLLRDLVTVLLRATPSERPSAKQILHIPAMHGHVNKVLARGRLQRSESVGSGSYEAVNARERSVWRRPEVLPVDKSSSVNQEGVSVVENEWKDARPVDEMWFNSREQQKVDKIEKPPEDLFVEMKACRRTRPKVRDERKRASSAVISTEFEGSQPYEERSHDAENGPFYSVGEISEHGQENHRHCGGTKPRSYSTSIVRETLERRPLKSLNVRPGETYDVIPVQRQLCKETYTVFDGAHSKPEERKRVGMRAKRCEGEEVETKYLKRRPSKFDSVQGSCTKESRATDLIKILFTSKVPNVGNLSPKESLDSYIFEMKSLLKDRLGDEMFFSLYDFLVTDMQGGLDSGIDPTEKLFELVGQENIECIPLLLQLVRCENACSTSNF